MNSPMLHVFENTDQVMEGLAIWLASQSKAHIQNHDVSYWAISGGKTPIALYQLLAKGRVDIDWASVNLFLADERDVFAKDPRSNYGLIEEVLLSHLLPPPGRVVGWQTLTDPRDALAQYRRQLTGLPRPQGFPQLDVALLGMGDDGHTASIFPSSPQEAASGWVAYGPGPLCPRFTLTHSLLTHAREVVFLVTGKAKSSRVVECLRDSNCDLPAAKVSRAAPSVHWFLDQESAHDL